MKYPRISEVEKRPRNTSAKCKCGAIGKNIVVIQVNYMRGDDDVVWACDKHKRDVDFLCSPMSKETMKCH